MRRKARALAIGCVIAMLAVFVSSCSLGGGPRDWLEENYTYVEGDDLEVEPIVYSSDDSSMDTAAAIIDGTGPDDRSSASSATGESLIYLRYDDDWIVTVGDDADGGARIELFEFDEAYNRHGAFIGFWGGFYGRGGFGGGGFRGGGGGFGK